MLGLDQMMDRVNAEAVHAAIEPEAQYRKHRGAHVGITPIEVRLLFQERMVVVLLRCLIPRPRAAAELAYPIIRHAAVRLAVAPDIPVALIVRARRAALGKPGMLVRGVIGHEIQNDLQGARVRRRDKPVEIRQRAEHWIDVRIVRHVVAEVRHRRGIDRRNPDCVNAELDKIVEPRPGAFQVADAVAVRVLERTRIDLIDNAALPPTVHPGHLVCPEAIRGRGQVKRARRARQIRSDADAANTLDKSEKIGSAMELAGASPVLRVHRPALVRWLGAAATSRVVNAINQRDGKNDRADDLGECQQAKALCRIKHGLQTRSSHAWFRRFDPYFCAGRSSVAVPPRARSSSGAASQSPSKIAAAAAAAAAPKTGASSAFAAATYISQMMPSASGTAAARISAEPSAWNPSVLSPS